MIIIIFSFSAQKGDSSGKLSYNVSFKVISTFNKLMSKEENITITNKKAESINLYVRKVAHCTEYFVLCGTVLFPFYVYGYRNLPLIFNTFIITIILASLDELHQHFIPGRCGSIVDVGIDGIGIVIFLLFHSFILRKKYYK